MSDSFRMDMPALPGFIRAMEAAPRTLEAEMLTAGKRIAFRGVQLSHVYVKRDTGATANSIHGDARSTGAGVEAIFGASSKAAIFVDKGRKPGKMPPQGVLLPWMAGHGIPESAEFVVRRKIGRDGIPPHPFVSRAHKEMLSSGFYHKEFADAITRTLAKVRIAA